MAPTLAHLGQAGKVLILVLLELQKKGEGQVVPQGPGEGEPRPQPLLPRRRSLSKHLEAFSLWEEGGEKDPATAIPRLKLGSEIPDQRLWNKQPRLKLDRLRTRSHNQAGHHLG